MSKKNKKTKEEVTNKFKVPDNHVHVNAFLHKDDLTIVLKTLMGKIYDRSTEDRAKITKKIWSNIDKRDAEKTLLNIQELMNADHRIHESLMHIVNMIEKLSELSPQTEVLKDLPNLEEDGLGVSSGSE
jgi:hypothetical protein